MFDILLFFMIYYFTVSKFILLSFDHIPVQLPCDATLQPRHCSDALLSFKYLRLITVRPLKNAPLVSFRQGTPAGNPGMPGKAGIQNRLKTLDSVSSTE